MAIALLLLAQSADLSAQINRWDNGQVIPGTEGITLGPGVQLDHRELVAADLQFKDLAGANFMASNLTKASLLDSNLTNADLTGVNLSNADLLSSTLTDANFTGAVVKGARFGRFHPPGLLPRSPFHLTESQLQSTGSYQSKDLSGIGLGYHDLRGWDFSGQNLAGAGLGETLMNDANLAGAVVTGTDFSRSSLSESQLQSTASYQSKNLNGIRLSNKNLWRWDLNGQNLTGAQLFDSNLTNANLKGANLSNAGLSSSILTNADLTGAVVTGAAFGNGILTQSQLQSTASYQSKDLRDIELFGTDLTGWDFNGQNLTGAFFWDSTLTNADLTGAVVTRASFGDTTSRGFTQAQLQSTASYQAKDLSRIGLNHNDLTGWDFSGQNLTGANLVWSTLTHTNLTGARLMNANFRGEDSNLSSAIFDSASVYNQWTVFPDDFDPVAAGLTFQATPLGDFDGDGQVDAIDLRLIEDLIRGVGSFLNMNFHGMDVNGDGPVNVADAEMWVDEIKSTWRGDANLDGVFDTTDLVQVFAAGEYEDSLIANSTWATGDWNFDREFSTADLIVAFQGGGYEQGPRANVAAVPEPSTWLLGLLTLPAILRRVRG